MNHKDINAGELAVKLEVQRSNISHILNGRNKPSATLIEKMLNVFPDLNARWLLTGKGNMLNNDSENLIQNNQDTQKDGIQQGETAKQQPSNTNEESRELLQTNATHATSTEDGLNKVVLLFDNGTFTTYKRKH